MTAHRGTALKVGFTRRTRLYYDVEDGPEPFVHVRAVGIKDHNELRIGGEIVKR
jgi:hypothetical protein